MTGALTLLADYVTIEWSTLLSSAFLGGVLSFMLEPFSLFGCVFAGSLLGKLRASLLAAAMWSFFVQYFIIKPRVETQQLVYRPEMLVAGILASLFTTAIVYYLANRKLRDK
jgi:hypothetical protein